MRKINALTAIVAVVITAALSGVVASSASSSTVYGCVSKAGALSKVSTKAHSCPKGTSKLSWGITGAAGATGSQGQPGAQGAQGQPGPQGAQGLAGSDGGGTVLFSGQVPFYGKTLLDWDAGNNADFSIVSTDKVVPAGNYYVTANSSFRYGSPYYCWIGLDVDGFFYTTAKFEADANAHDPNIDSQNTSISTALTVPAGGSKISFSCAGDTTAQTYWAQISALKIASLNPNN